jgi:hypothetical protein
MMTGIEDVSSVRTLTLRSSNSLSDEVSRFHSHQRTVKDFETDLGFLITVLGSIHQQGQLSQDGDRYEPLRHPLHCCQATCQEMEEKLKASHSLRDWLNMHDRGQSFADMKKRLTSYTSVLSIVFAIINMYTATILFRARRLTLLVVIILQHKNCAKGSEMISKVRRKS